MRKAIQIAFLEEGISRVKLAKRFGVHRQTIARILDGEDFHELEAHVFEQRKAEALRVLKRAAVKAAEQWSGPALMKAAKKGNHAPSKDLLKAAGVIEDTDAPRIVVQVGVKLTGHPEV